LTKNPFDSTTDGRLMLPALSASPSIFSQTHTPGSQKVRIFEHFESVGVLKYRKLHLFCCKLVIYGRKCWCL
jgi:hypothetical protein